VFGHAKGGTSALAGAVRLLGIPMSGNHLTSDDCVTLSEEMIAERNGINEVWGFKNPSFLSEAQRLQGQLRNPFFLFIYRDPVAITTNNGAPFNDGLLNEVNRLHERLLSTYQEIKVPKLLISYERLIFDSEKSIGQIAEFLGVKPREKAVDFVKHSDGYKDIRIFL
jgi:hypothetical protein